MAGVTRDFGDEPNRPLSYWDGLLAGFGDPTPLTNVRPRSDSDLNGVSGFAIAELSQAQLTQLEAAESRHGLTLETQLFGAWALVHNRYSGSDELVFGAGAGAGKAFHVRTDTSPGQPLGPWLAAIQEQCEASRNALGEGDAPPGRALHQVVVQLGEDLSGPYPLIASLARSDGGAQLQLKFDRAIFGESMMTAMVGQLAHTLTAIASRGDAALIESISVLRPIDLDQFGKWQGLRAPYDLSKTVTDRLIAQAKRTPSAIALIKDDEQVTFAELMERAEGVARELDIRGIGPEIPVGIAITHSIEMVVALVGTLLTGAPYLPLDPKYPKDRLKLMLTVSEAPVILTVLEAIVSLPEAPSVELIDVRMIAPVRGESSRTCQATPESTMAVTFTSGSTGEPKGVRIHHAGVVNRSEWQYAEYPLEDDEVIPAKTTLSFVDHIWEIWGGLQVGNPVLLIDDRTVTDGDALIDALAKWNVRRITLVPSMLDYLMDHAPDLAERLPRLTQWSASGEAIATATVERFAQVMPDATLINLYGMSEASPDATWIELSAGLTDVPIGRPVHNVEIYLLDRHDRPVPVGIPGHLHVSGVALSPGYWKRPELTAERFVPNPAAESDQDPFARMYRSGDVGRWREDGVIEYLGRSDHQIKIRGIRIELGEVETALTNHPAVDRAVAVGQKSKSGIELVAYIVVEDGGDSVSGSEIRLKVAESLPAAMVPTHVVALQEFPLLPNGKVNRHALPEPASRSLDGGSESSGSDNVAEKKMVAIWREILDEPAIGIDTNFFDAGGNSLVAMRLVSRIARDLDVRLGLDQLLGNETPRLLCQSLSADSVQVTRRLVPLQPIDDDVQNLFIVHGAGGNVMRFRSLSLAAKGDLNVIGIQAAGVDGVEEMHSSREQALAEYKKSIRSAQPHGPYVLGGYSLGGIIAVELAKELRHEGEIVDAVVLFDTFHPTLEPRKIPKHEHLARVFKERQEFVREVLEYRRADAEERASSDPIIVRRRLLVQRLNELWDSHDPGLVNERVIMMATEEAANIWDQAPLDRGWDLSVPNLSVHQVPGDHDTLFAEENSAVVAAYLVGDLNSRQPSDSVLGSNPSQRQ